VAIANLALSYVGSQAWGSGSSTLCETFVEKMAGCGWQGTSAIDAWRNNVPRQQTDMSQVQPGDALYFGPHAENEFYGHTGIYTGIDSFTSVTAFGVKVYALSAWVAPLLGFIRYE